MAINIQNAFVATPPIDGGVYFNAPVGTPLPKTATEALNSAFVDHGAVGEDGFNNTPTRETSTEKMFGGDDWVDLQTSYTETVTITLLEDDNEHVLKSCFGDANVIEKAATDKHGRQRTIYHTAERLPLKSHIVKAVSGEKAKTLVVPNGRISTVEKTAETHSASTKYNVTITAFKGPQEYKYANVFELRDDGMVDPNTPDPDTQDKTVTLPSGVTGGTFTLSVDGHATAELAFNATADTVQAELRKLTGATTATITGNAGGPYTIKDVTGALTADGTKLTGGAGTTITVNP